MRTQEVIQPPIDGEGLIGSLFNKTVSSNALKKVASTLTSKATKDMVKKAVQNAVEKGGNELGSAVGKIAGNKISKMTQPKHTNANGDRDKIKDLLLRHSANVNVRSGSSRMDLSREFDKLLN